MEYKGSVTVFLSFTILMIISLILSLIEVTHYMSLEKLTGYVSDIGIESTFADFNRPLLDDYRILGIDCGYCEQIMNLKKTENRMLDYLNDNINYEGTNFMRALPIEASIDEYGLLTDSSGAAFIKEAAEVAAYDIPQDLLSRLTATANLTDADSFDEDQVSNLLNETNSKIEQSKGIPLDNNLENIESPLSAEDQTLLEQNGNPIDSALEWKNQAVLSQVVADVSVLSTDTMNAECPSKRGVSTWRTSKTLRVSGTEKVLFSQYLNGNFSSYKNNYNHKGLQYEWEYVICGKTSDISNLEAVVGKLLAARETTNMAFLISDPTKISEAEGIAMAICAALAVPALVEAVKWGIVAAWAYLESVLDVRLLLAGGSVPAVKSPSNWTSNILLFPTYVSPHVMAKDVGNGMKYEDYLMIMTMLTSTNQLGCRSLDVVENAIRKTTDYSNIRIENFLYSAKVTMSYEVVPIFATLTPMLQGYLSNYRFVKNKELSYI